MAVYSVSQVLSYLNDILAEDPVVRDFWVEGEVANLVQASSGHYYFTLRGSNSTLRCVMFRTSAFGADSLSNGEAVVAHGRMSIYEARGDVQLIADLVKPEGLGELQLRLEELKLKLDREGMFSASRKRELPSFPKRIAIVTSPTGAVWHDIKSVVERRFPIAELLLVPASVQGDSAAPEIVNSFHLIDEIGEIDAVIVARGGGSLEDLWPFNEEIVARAIYSSPAPVVSAVGHETDVTIADLVADKRAPTPSAAAEMVVPDKHVLVSKIAGQQQTLITGITNLVRYHSEAISHLRHRVVRGAPDLSSMRIRIDDVLMTAAKRLEYKIGIESERVQGLEGRLESLSPGDTLRRGYSIVQKKSDMVVVSDAKEVVSGERVEITLADGGIEAEIVATRGGQYGSKKA